ARRAHAAARGQRGGGHAGARARRGAAADPLPRCARRVGGRVGLGGNAPPAARHRAAHRDRAGARRTARRGARVRGGGRADRGGGAVMRAALRRCAGRRGFALLATLWLIVVLGGVAADFQTGARADVRIAANARAAARARWAAHGGLARTLAAPDRVLAANLGARLLAAAGDTLRPPLRVDTDGVRVET